MSEERDDIFGRWSRRKKAVRREAEEALTETPPPSEPEVQDKSEETDEEVLARLGLPDPDALQAGDDFSAFMKAGVPDLIRRRALRRLWTSNPVLANVDGLVEYGENYAAPELTPAVVATAYKVGRGFLKDVLEDEHQEADEAPASVSEPEKVAAGPQADLVSDPDDEPHDRDELSHPETVAEAPTVGPLDELEQENPLRPKRMRFTPNT